MNYENLHELIKRYEQNIDRIYNSDHDELFKWRAMYVWRQEWFKPAGAFANFADRFNAAKKEFSLFIDNSRMHPSSGVIKLWEKDPQAVESLFTDVLFADSAGSVSIVQNNMDSFLEQYEGLRQKYYPGNWSFKQDRHSASVFLSMNDPNFNYVFKSSEALTMAKYVGFDFSIGAGMSFSLEHYYSLGDEIVSALQEHQSLLEKHFNRLVDGYYVDKSLHLLAFDLMYCCRTYGYYKGLVAPSAGNATRNAVSTGLTSKEKEELEKERLTKIEAIEQEIEDLDRSCDGCAEISLIGVNVSSSQYGVGTVVAQEINTIYVQFEHEKKIFILDKKFPARPRFENDDEIVSAFSDYGQAQDRIKKLKSQLEALQNS